MRALRRLEGGRRPCGTLAASDALSAALQLPSNWKRGNVAKNAIRVPVKLLAAAERRLLRKAGRKCAVPMNRTKRVAPRKGGLGFEPLPQPPEGPEQGEGRPISSGKFRPIKSIGGASGPGADLHALAGTPDRTAKIASDPLTFFRSSDVGIPPRQASPEEPTTAEGDNVVWFTGNSSVALSTDAGRTFTTFNPSNLLPDSGLPLCCDQLVSYSPQAHLFIWVIQYWCGTGSTKPATNNCRTAGAASNRIRIAVATPTDLRNDASNPGAAWTYWDVTPQTFGQPAGAWFDRSDLGLNIWNMNWTVDVLRGNGGVASVLTRISLSDLRHRGSLSIGYITDGNQRMTVAQGLNTTTTYFVGTDSLSQQKIWSLAAFSSTLFKHDPTHTSVPIFNSATTGSDGGDWYDRYGIFPGAVESATVSGGTLYTAQGAGRAYCVAHCNDPKNPPTLQQVLKEPAIFISKYDVNSWSNVGERWIWNSTLSFAWPELQTDGAGEVGLVFRAAADNHNARPVAGFLTPAEQFVYADPEGLPHRTGDYYTLRPGRTLRSFVMTAQTVVPDVSTGTNQMHWQYIEYGHGASPYVSPPNVHITTPTDLATFTQGDSVTYSANVSDPVDGTLPASAIVWTEDGSFIGTGPSVARTEDAIGTHLIKVTATNGDGKSASDSVSVRINPKPGGAALVDHQPSGPKRIPWPIQQRSIGLLRQRLLYDVRLGRRRAGHVQVGGRQGSGRAAAAIHGRLPNARPLHRRAVRLQQHTRPNGDGLGRRQHSVSIIAHLHPRAADPIVRSPDRSALLAGEPVDLQRAATALRYPLRGRHLQSRRAWTARPSTRCRCWNRRSAPLRAASGRPRSSRSHPG